MRITKRHIAAGAAGFIVVIAFGAGWFAGSHRSQAIAVSEGAPVEADLAPLFKAWGLLEKNFASASSTAATTTPTERVYGAIQGLAASYGDPYTVFFPPRENADFAAQVKGDFGGVGMEVGVKEGILVVVAPLKDTPASRAGIQTGDAILEIDGADTSGVAVEDAVGKIRGEKGTSVTLTLSRKTKEEGKPFEVTLVRDTITIPTLDTELRGDGVFVLSLYSFDANAPEAFRKALQEFARSGSDKLLLDLRGNPGGYLEAAVDMSSWFLPPGKVIVTEDYEGTNRDTPHRSYGYDVFTNQLKFAILINGGTASAAEIMAGALSQNDKATLIGTQSFGKGSVQQLFPVTSDTSLKITVAQWLTPNGTSISHAGLTPDIKVEISDADREAKRDPQLERGVQYLLNGS